MNRGSEMGPVAYIGLCLLSWLVFNPSLAAPGLSVEAQAASCPEGWFYIHGNCYRYISEKKSWKAAEAECQQHGNGAHLASIHSAGENKNLALYVKRQHKESSAVWIGLSDPEENLNWRWADKSPMNFSAWDKGQPSSLRKNEHCVALHDRIDFQQWHDYPCEARLSFVCEQKDSSTAPGGSRRLGCE